MAASLASGGMLGVTQKKQLQSFAQRAVALLEQRDELNADITEVMNEAKEAGFDTKILRKVVKIIRTDKEVRKAEQEMIDSYVEAIQPDLFAAKAA